MAGSTDRCGPGGAVPRAGGAPGPCPRPPPVPLGDPGVTTVLFATSVRLPHICSPFKCGLFLCAALWGERVKGAEVTAGVGGSSVALIRGWRAVAVPFLGLQGALVFPSWGSRPGRPVAVRVQPLAVGGRGRCELLLCAPHLPCPHLSGPAGRRRMPRPPVGWLWVEWGPGSGVGRGLHLPFPTPTARGLILSGGGSDCPPAPHGPPSAPTVPLVMEVRGMLWAGGQRAKTL